MDQPPTPSSVAIERMLQGRIGRALCEDVATVPGFGPVVMPWHWPRLAGRPEPTASQLLDELEAVVATGNYRRFLAQADEGRLVRDLQRAGRSATNPVSRGDTANDDRTVAILQPVAAALLAAPATQWWSSPSPAHDQHLVDRRDFADDVYQPPHPDVRAELARGVATETERERNLQVDDPVGFPPPPNYAPTGYWWSTPPTAWRTTRSVPGQPALPALGLIWDWSLDGTVHTQHWLVHVADQARIYEIDGVDTWRSLVERYPRHVTYSRRSAWWAGTGWDGPWLLPDWTAVAADYDGVHLSVTGFLEAAQQVVPVGEGLTTLVIWEPDDTFWLNDVVRLDSGPHQWNASEDWTYDWSNVVIGHNGDISITSPDTERGH
jgi:hypothetical protein